MKTSYAAWKVGRYAGTATIREVTCSNWELREVTSAGKELRLLFRARVQMTSSVKQTDVKQIKEAHSDSETYVPNVALIVCR